MTGEFPRGELCRLRVESEVLRDNPLGDPFERDLWVWLPPGYADSERGYPTLYVLTGFTGRGRMALNDNPWSPGFDRRFEGLLARGEVEPAIVVFPDCFTRLGGSQYLDSPALGAYETHLCEEILPFVDREFRTLGNGHRGVLGKSSGGYGALRLGMRRPDLFQAVASHSGDMAFELCYPPDFPTAARMLTRSGGVAGFLRDFGRKEKKTAPQIQTLNICAMAAAYSPREDGGFDLPFEIRDLRRIPEVWTRWEAQDPIRMLDEPSAVEALRGMKVLFLDAGLRDQFQLDFGARRMTDRLTSLGIPHVHEEFDDDHFSLSYRYDRSLPLLTRALAG